MILTSFLLFLKGKINEDLPQSMAKDVALILTHVDMDSEFNG